MNVFPLNSLSATVRSRKHVRSGQALLEFAIVAFVLTLLLAGVLAMGLLLVSANVLQQAADVAAQELARHPYSATGTFEDGLADSDLFDDTMLIVSTNTDAATLPLINRLLFPLYVYDPDRDVLRYPGTVVNNPDGNETVLIPLVEHTAAGDEEITAWRFVVDEIPEDAASDGPYAIDSTNIGSLPAAGFVALRINYPYQNAALVGYVRVDSGGNVLNATDVIGADVTNVGVVADDDAISSVALPAGYTLSTTTENAAFGASVSRGDYGLGEVQALGTEVRPYRKVIAAQGIYRREVLLP